MEQQDIFSGINNKLLLDFADYHMKNPYVYNRFTELANELKLSGKKKYSAWAIIQRIRWDYDLRTEESGESFRINNNYTALYARLLIKSNPDFKGFFILKRMKESHV